MRFRHGNGGEGAAPAGPDSRSRAAAAATLAASGESVTVGDGPDLLREVLAVAPVGVALLDERLRWLCLNAAFTTATGLRRADLLGRPVESTAFAAAVGTLHHVLADGRRREQTTGGPDGAGAPVPAGLRVRYRPLEAGGRITGVVVVVLDDPGPEQELRRELAQARARLALLEAAAERIGTTLDVGTTCTELASFAVPRLAELVTVDVLPPDSTAHTGRAGGLRLHRAAVQCTGRLSEAAAAPAGPGETVRYREGSAAARALTAGVAVLANGADDGLAHAAPDPAALAACRAAGLTSLLAVPLSARGRLVGLLTLARTAASPGFTPDEAALIGDLAARAATGIDNARRYTRDAVALHRRPGRTTGRGHRHLPRPPRRPPPARRRRAGRPAGRRPARPRPHRADRPGRRGRHRRPGGQAAPAGGRAGPAAAALR
ncbi:GAF domain-containing protein [Kitasatospora sp. NBC_00085]